MSKFHKFSLLGYAPPFGYRKLQPKEILTREDFYYKVHEQELGKITLYPTNIGAKVYSDDNYNGWFWVRKLSN